MIPLLEREIAPQTLDRKRDHHCTVATRGVFSWSSVELSVCCGRYIFSAVRIWLVPRSRALAVREPGEGSCSRRSDEAFTQFHPRLTSFSSALESTKSSQERVRARVAHMRDCHALADMAPPGMSYR